MAMPERARPPAWQRAARGGLVWLAALLIAAGLLVALATWSRPLYQFATDQERIRAWVAQLGLLGPLGIIALQVAQTLIAPIPGQAVGVVSGYLYGLWWGTLYAMAGLVAGSLLGFLLARFLGRPLLRQLVGEHSLARLDDLARRGGALLFFLIWVLPFTPDDLACLAAGLTPMPTRQFLILVTLGRLPGVLLTTWIGANAVRIGPTWWAIGIGALALAALVVWRWRGPIERSLLRFLDRLAGLPRA
jgi:uncharacterized membrane protein YdjX (TVP38/TMEM64 family)